VLSRMIFGAKVVDTSVPIRSAPAALAEADRP
jgi:hypothetical protein